jgi:RecB family exonuclease
MTETLREVPKSIYHTENSIGFKLSNSSAGVFRGCKRRFWHKSIAKTEKDPDFDDNSKALVIGRIYHRVLELAEHERDNLADFMLHAAANENDCSDSQILGLVWAMVDKYLELHEKSGLKAVAIEIPVTDDKVIGFVDVILKETDGHWWIVDLKTAATLSKSLLGKLKQDPQLNLYSYFAEDIAKAHGLDLDKWSGIRYRVTTKSTARIRSNENITSFSERVARTIEAYDIAIPKADLNPGLAYDQIMDIYKEVEVLKTLPESSVPQNFGYCEQYFKPCPYWSRCYGTTHTDSGKDVPIFNSQDMPDVNELIETFDHSELDIDYIDDLLLGEDYEHARQH